MNIEQPGIYCHIDEASYFRDPCPKPSLSQSIAKILIDRSPLHAKLAHPRLAPPTDEDEETEKYVKAQAIGNAAHKLMLGRGRDVALIKFDNFMSKPAKEAKADALAAGKLVILEKHMEIAAKMVAAGREQLEQIPDCEMAFAAGDAEVMVAALVDDIWMRSLIDWLTTDQREVWDYKTTGMSASPYAASKMMASAGWHIQAATHELILSTIDPKLSGRRKFRYVCQEQEPPFALCVSEMSEGALTIGRKQLAYARAAWAQCLKLNRWPAYPLHIIMPDLPNWQATAWLEREEAEADMPMSDAAKLIMAG